MELTKSLIIFTITCLFYIFVYYKIHRKDITPILFFTIGGTACLYGAFLFFIKKAISFSAISPIFYITALFLTATLLIEAYGLTKVKMNKDIDITLTWTERLFPFVPWYFWLLLAFPVFVFIPMATFYILGPEHIFLWIPLFICWIISGIRLIKYVFYKII